MSRGIIYVPFHDVRKWQREGVRTRDGHVHRQLRRNWAGWKTIVVDRPTCLAEWIRLGGRSTARGRTLRSAGGAALTQAEGGELTYDYLALHPGFVRGSFHSWLARAYGGSSYLNQLAGIQGDVRLDESVLWLCHPFAYRMAEALQQKDVVFDAFDNFAIHPELSAASRRAAAAGYEYLARSARVIAVNSVASQQYFWQVARRETVLVPNGVDPALFKDASPLALLAGIAHPVIGYAGKLGKRIDVELLLQLADALTSGTIVLAGQVLDRTSVGALLRDPRIHHLGDLPYSSVPSFLAACDVCIVPHAVGTGENAGDPTKIYEYLAAGKPVISTAIGGTERFAGRIVRATNHEEFIDATLAAAHGEAGVIRGELREEETWAARTASLMREFGLDSRVGNG